MLYPLSPLFSLRLPYKFGLLLGLFVKPMLAPQGSTQSGGAFYRSVVIRNVICTIGVVIAYVITTVVFILAIRRESSDNDKVRGVRRESHLNTLHPTFCVRFR